ncbi:MAG: RsmD family RNA methyltransferase [Synergistaceae bacterium]|nr:RsmD family RNA methyltransferase [Synergistaceae bacterium]
MKDVRPTSGRVLSALFSILGDKVNGSAFLDVFAGTGHVGLEAMKRGAGSCVFIESVKSRAEDIKRYAGDSLVLSLDVRRAVSWLVKRDMKFDIIFADPPYDSGWCDVLPALKDITRLFDDECVFVIEHSVREDLTLNDNPNKLEIISRREYGETCLTFLKKTE